MFNNSLMSNSYSNSPTATQDPPASLPPSFLFSNSNKRRSVALSNANPYLNSPLAFSTGPSSDVFASPIPAHVKESTPSSVSAGGKSVHWSPAVQDEVSRPISRIGSPSLTKGPPLRSLRDEMDSPVPKHPRQSVPSTPSQLADNSPPSATDHWVTVFGFPPNYTDKVLKLMSRHGEIVSQHVPPRGNWVNIRYSCVPHAQQALARNASLIDGVVRIGVVPCTDHEAMEAANKSSLNLSLLDDSRIDENRQELPPPMPSTVETSFLSPSVRDTSSISRAGSFRSASRSGMRSLAAGTSRLNESRGGEVQKQEGLMGRLWSLVG